jgi:hypothetical protein
MTEKPKTTAEITRRDLAALVLKQLTDPGYTGAGPDFESLYKMPKDLLELAFVVLGAGTDREARQRRMMAEVLARPAYGDMFLREIQAADPNRDPAALGIEDGWKFLTMADIFEDLPPLEWLVKPYLPRQAVGVFFGKPKSLKSMISLDLALHVAAGQNWLTRPNNKNGGMPVTGAGVLWVDLENGKRTSQARVQALARALELPKDTPFYLLSMPSPWPVMPDQVGLLIEHLQAYNGAIGLVVIDHFSQILGGIDENAPQVSEVMAALRSVTERADVAVLIIHHQIKSSGGKGRGYDAADTMRGSGAILAGVDIAVQVLRDAVEKNKILLKVVAVRGPDASDVAAQWTYDQDQSLDLQQARFWRDDIVTLSERIQDAILEALEGKTLNQRGLRAAVAKMVPGAGDSAIRDTITLLENNGTIAYKEGKKNAHLYYLPGEEQEGVEEDT